MRIKLILLFQILLSLTFCKAQSGLLKDVIITSEVSCYILEDNEMTSLMYKMVNNSKDVLWLWMDKTDISALPDIDKFKKYFYYRDTPADMNLLQIGMDGGVETFLPTIYKTFLKRIYPGQEFIIQVLADGKIPYSIQQDVFEFIEKRIVIITEGKISKFKKGITDMSQIIFYKPDILSIPKGSLKF